LHRRPLVRRAVVVQLKSAHTGSQIHSTLSSFSSSSYTINNNTMFTANHAAAARTQMTAVPAWAAAPGHDAASCFAVHRPILAERFRTKMCRNFLERGACPYVHRCMFAHGESELRTTEQNVADRLFSEDAIRAFKRYHYEQAKARAFAEYTETVSSPTCGCDSCSVGTATPPPELASPMPKRASIRRHDPYAMKSEWHPLGRASTSDDDGASSCGSASPFPALSVRAAL